MSVYKIEKGIPPPPTEKQIHPLLDVILRMEVGDSIVAEPNVFTYASIAKKKRPGVKFTGRSIDHSSVRLWRIK